MCFVSIFFASDFGSAKALIKGIKYTNLEYDVRLELIELFNIVLLSKRKTTFKFERLDTFISLFDDDNFGKINDFFNGFKSIQDYGVFSFFVEGFYAVAKISLNNSARILLPKYSVIPGPTANGFPTDAQQRNQKDWDSYPHTDKPSAGRGSSENPWKVPRLS